MHRVYGILLERNSMPDISLHYCNKGVKIHKSLVRRYTSLALSDLGSVILTFVAWIGCSVFFQVF